MLYKTRSKQLFTVKLQLMFCETLKMVNEYGAKLCIFTTV